MSLTGDAILQAFSEFINDWYSAATTTAGNSGGTTAVSTSLKRFGDNRLQGRHLRLHIATYPVRIITSNTQSTGTANVTEAFAAQVPTTTTFSVHRYEPKKKFLALDSARLEVMDHLFTSVRDATLTSDGRSTVYDRPTAVEQGPHIAYFETPLAPVQDWNFLAQPEGNASTGYTASGMTLSTRDRTQTDLVVPKLEDTCVQFSVAATTNGTATLAVADMDNDITAALAAGRRMTFARWVYCTTASRVTLKIVEDGAVTTTGTAHQGKGWELLTVEKTIGPTNATTLSVVLDVSNSAAAVTGFWERGWFYFGDKERVVDSSFNFEAPVKARADDTNKHIVLDECPPRGYQIMLQGKGPLSSLGTDPDTQVTNTMEMDTKSAGILYARAAELMLEWQAIISDDVPSVMQRISLINSRKPKIERNWEVNYERPHFRSPFGR